MVSINAPKRLKLYVLHCKLLNYLNWNLGSAEKKNNTTRRPSETLELSQLTAEPHARGLRPRNISLIPCGLETTVREVLETEKRKRSVLKTTLRHIVKIRTQ